MHDRFLVKEDIRSLVFILSKKPPPPPLPPPLLPLPQFKTDKIFPPKGGKEGRPTESESGRKSEGQRPRAAPAFPRNRHEHDVSSPLGLPLFLSLLPSFPFRGDFRVWTQLSCVMCNPKRQLFDAVPPLRHPECEASTKIDACYNFMHPHGRKNTQRSVISFAKSVYLPLNN